MRSLCVTGGAVEKLNDAPQEPGFRRVGLVPEPALLRGAGVSLVVPDIFDELKQEGLTRVLQPGVVDTS